MGLAKYDGLVYIGMKVDSKGRPIVHSGANVDGENAANSLGLRANNADKRNLSGATSIDALPSHRKPIQHGGDVKNAEVFSIDSSKLDQYGLYADNDHDEHVGIKPKDENMTDKELEKAIADTEKEWVVCQIKK